MTNLEISSNILQIIEQHNLSIRRIPSTVVATYEMRHFKEGDTVVEQNGRKFARRVSVPLHAGHYLCQSVNNTGSTVSWNAKEHNLAKTLVESVALFLSKL